VAGAKGLNVESPYGASGHMKAARRVVCVLVPLLCLVTRGVGAQAEPGHALWNANGRPTEQAMAIVAELEGAESRGLWAADYDAAPLSAALHSGETSASVDARLTRMAMRFVDHVHNGRVDPRTLSFALPHPAERLGVATVVEELSRSRDVHAAIDSLEPHFPRFRALKSLLARYRTLAADSGLAALPERQVTVRPGDRWSGTTALRALLAATGDVPEAAGGAVAGADSDQLDSGLVEAVKRFQQHHGLVADGIIGRLTMAELRTPFASRVAQIELTMERWRWLSGVDAPRLIVVNIPEFHLYALERSANGARTDEVMDVIVGSAYNGRRTPVFASDMRYVVFHPYWDVPRSIARREEIPHIRRDPGYADREGMEIVRGGDVGAVTYAMTPPNMQRVIDGTLRLRQRPGPRNALGAVKFVFPNPYNVYLHGTPAEYLFAQVRRDFSHGCVRASDPAALADFVLRDEGWDRTRIDDAMDGEEVMRSVTLKHPIRVLIVYATVVVDENGVPSFYPDIYGHDAALARMLHLRAPRVEARVLAPGRGVYGDGDCLTDTCTCKS
jgi:murein L,D-transpeptidase YcbB/YkuD